METKMIRMLLENAQITQTEMAKAINMPVSTIKYYFTRGKDKGVIVRVGISQKGKWVVKYK
ncbi:MAG: winged helix-turn-helix domain-containing protein [Erysipelotrichia bacterium]|nr:winged helix-turn-helix domain-containing protein [Erysipelotrichia bacterium]